MPERELKIRHTTVGAEEAKAKIEGLADAEEKPKGQVEGLGESTEDLSVKKENLTNILNRIHPSLGALADTVANAGELAGDLASKNIDLKGSFDAVRGSVLKNIGAIKLLGAGGAAVAPRDHGTHAIRAGRGGVIDGQETHRRLEKHGRAAARVGPPTGGRARRRAGTGAGCSPAWPGSGHDRREAAYRSTGAPFQAQPERQDRPR